MHLIYQWLWRLLPGNPMVVRIVQGGSRRYRHLLVRMGYLGALILLVLVALLSGGGMQANVSLTELAKAGTSVFVVVGYGQVILICLLAPLFMAGAISAEQSGQTMNILLTTPLSNLQIVLGSLAGRLFFVWALLAGGLPLFAVLLIFGGVPINSVFVSFGVAAMSALVAGSVAVALAVSRAGGRKAVFVFIISVAGYLVGAYVLDRLILRQAAPNSTTWLTPLHPILVLEASLSGATYHPPDPVTLAGHSRLVQLYLSRPFAAFCTLSALASAVLMLWSATQVRNVGQGPGIMGRIRRRLRLQGAAGQRQRAGREVWHNPIAWREANTRGRGVLGVLARWSFLILMLGAAAILLLLYDHGRLTGYKDGNLPMPAHDVFRYGLMTLLLVELAVVTLVAIYMSAGSISREREDRTLDLLLTTPITPRQYVWGKLRGLVSFLTLLLAAPVLTLAMVAGYSMIGTMRGWAGASVTYGTAGGGPRPLLLPEAPILLGLMLVPYVAMCVMVGMTWSVKSKGVLGSLAPTIGIVGMAALVMGFCGWHSAENIEFIGPIINGFSPTTNLVMVIDPWEHVNNFIASPEQEAVGRISLGIAALVTAGAYSLVIYSLLVGLVKGFDQTVRHLTGTA